MDGQLTTFFEGVTVMIPMVFPIEQKHPQQGRNRIRHVFKSAISDPAAFYSYMCMSAAHRAIIYGRHSELLFISGGSDRQLTEPDYYIMKAKCFKAITAKMQDPREATSDGAFETVLTLLGSSVRTFFLWHDWCLLQPWDSNAIECTLDLYAALHI